MNFSIKDLRPDVQPDGILSEERGPELIKRALNGEKLVFEWMYMDVLKNTILCEVHLSTFTWKGRIFCRSSINEISERKQYEIKLIESEQRYKSLIDRNPDGVYSFDRQGRFVSVNAALSVITEYSMDQLLTLSFTDLLIPEEHERVMQYFYRAWEGKSDTFEVEIMTGKGKRRTLSLTGIPIVVDKETTALYGSAKDITESKRYTEEMAKAAQQLRSIYESISDAFLTLDKDWNIIIVNKEYENLSGQSREELIGKNYWEVTRYAKNSEYEKYFYQAMETCQPLYYELEFLSVWYGVALYPSEVSLSIYIKNITDKKIAEKKLQSSLHEKEVLLAEIHHRVKNNLAIISSLLQLQSYTIKDVKVKEALQDSKHRIQSIALVHQKLYQSEELSHIPMQQYISQLLSQLKISFISDKTIHMQIDANEVQLNIVKAVPCGLILNELFTNIYKHAFVGKEGGMVWVNFNRNDGFYELIVKDNGIGLPDGFNIESSDSMGMQLITMLTQQLGGEIQVISKEGTTVIIRFKE